MSLAYKNMIVKKKDNWGTIIQQMYIMGLDIAVSHYKWKNLPEDIPFYMPEYLLYLYGQCVFFNEGGHYFMLPSVINNSLNLYGVPYMVNAIAIGGEGIVKQDLRVLKCGKTLEDIKEPNAVEVIPNIERISMVAKTAPYLDRLDYLWSTMGINQALSRVQVLGICSKGQYAEFERVLNKLLDKRSPLALVRSKTIMDNVEKLDFNVDYLCDKYWYDFDKCLAMLCTILGIKCNFASQKKERLITAEVDANDEIIAILNDSALEFRLKAVEKINKMFGLNIEIEENKDFEKPEIMVDDKESVKEEDGE